MFKNFSEIIARARVLKAKKLVIAGGDDAVIIQAALEAKALGIAEPLLFCTAAQPTAEGLTVVLTDTTEAACLQAVAAVREDPSAVLMKGMVNTSHFMRAVLNAESGLRQGKLLSLLAVYEHPAYHKLLYCSDSGINVQPDLDKKSQILANLLEALHKLGLTEPKIAALTANELMDPKVISTVEAAELARQAERGDFGPCIVEGPISFDIAFSREAMAHKGASSRISGDVDGLLFSNMEVGNVLAKSWLLFDKAQWGSVVLGGRNPIVLGSRSDTAQLKINSMALAAVLADQNTK